MSEVLAGNEKGEIDLSFRSPYLVLGLDIGIASVGWAILDLANSHIVAVGVRVWDKSEHPRDGRSYAKIRRLQRATRNNTARRKNRAKHCLKIMKKHGLLSSEVDADWLQTRKGDKPTGKLRVKGLDFLLTERQWAQVLYSLVKSRGYIDHSTDADLAAKMARQGSSSVNEGSSDSGVSDEEKDDKKTLDAILRNQELMSLSGSRTVGELFAQSGRFRNRAKEYSHSKSIEQIKQEIRTLFKSQRSLGNAYASEGFESEYLDCLTWQKEVTGKDEANYRKVGGCIYHPLQRRAPRASLSSEMCNLHERISNLVIVAPDGTESAVNPEVRNAFVSTMFQPVKTKGVVDSCTYKALRKFIPGMKSDMKFKGIDESSKLVIAGGWAKLRSVLSEELMIRLSANRRLTDQVLSAIAISSSIPSLEKRLRSLCLSESDLVELKRVPINSKVFSGRSSRSASSLRSIVRAFERGARSLAEAEQIAGLKLAKCASQKSEKLPPYSDFDPVCTNPVVLTAMREVRKVVNELSDYYGLMNEVHIELSRDLRNSRKIRAEIESKLRKRTKARAANAKRLEEEIENLVAEGRLAGPVEIDCKLLVKYELWKEQGERDIYTGRGIDLETLLTPNACQVDHILPYSRTAIDGLVNKVLVLASSNQDKGNRTPYEWFSHTEAMNWDDFVHRVSSSKLSKGKKAYLTRTELSEADERGFLNRNLNDTKYASLRAKAYIEEHLLMGEPKGKVSVLAVKGGATAALRGAWGIKKNRAEGDLHHAVDAAVIAACDAAAVQRIAQAHKKKQLVKKEEKRELFIRSEPWDGFVSELYKAVELCVPSRRVRHKLNGSAFKDTRYRFLGVSEDSGLGLYLSSKGKVEGTQTYHLSKDNKTVLLIDRQAFVRLWWDDGADAKKKASFLIEPVYYYDLPAMRKGTYRPRFVPPKSSKRPIHLWDPVPDYCLLRKPIMLFPGDTILVKGRPAVFRSIHLDNRNWELESVFSRKGKAEGICTIAQCRPEDISIISRDCII
ncbi:type II CRISPR RNA-guided endonuclease Cas9 [Eggerthellaceae bacterium zg-997]|nr:type II CRISPR RNA-guided endonuclease Cas9 [Eggerthellaceae bacterium zg-997]